MIKLPLSSNPLWIRLNYWYLLLIMAAVCFFVSAALYLQYFKHELPCPLCSLQRIGFLGIGFGIMLMLRHKFSFRYVGFSLLFTVFLLVVSIRQSLLDITPRPGHAWIGTAILGLHMPVWSVLISLFLLLVYAIQLSIMTDNNITTPVSITNYPVINGVARLLIIYTILLCLINLISTFLQCGFQSCHTYSYLLLH